MNLRPILIPAVVAIVLTTSGCVSDPQEERAQGYQECQDKLTPQFDDPTAVTWPEDGWGWSGSGDSRQVVAVVDIEGGEDDARIEVSCMLTATDDGWQLSSYEFDEPRGEVVG